MTDVRRLLDDDPLSKVGVCCGLFDNENFVDEPVETVFAKRVVDEVLDAMLAVEVGICCEVVIGCMVEWDSISEAMTDVTCPVDVK